MMTIAAAAAMSGQRLRGGTFDVCAGAAAAKPADDADAAAVADVADPAAGCAVVMGAALVPPDGVIAAIAWPLEGTARAAGPPNAPPFFCVTGCAGGTNPGMRVGPAARFS